MSSVFPCQTEGLAPALVVATAANPGVTSQALATASMANVERMLASKGDMTTFIEAKLLTAARDAARLCKGCWRKEEWLVADKQEVALSRSREPVALRNHRVSRPWCDDLRGPRQRRLRWFNGIATIAVLMLGFFRIAGSTE